MAGLSQAGRKQRRKQARERKIRQVEKDRGIMNQATRIVGIDDGHSETKIASFRDGATGPLETWSYASRTTIGYEEIGMNGGTPPNFYALLDSADDIPPPHKTRQLTVIERGKRGWVGADGSRDPDYAVSDRNRVLVHHALHMIAAKHPGCAFEIATTLPYSDFYLPGGQPDRERTAAKKANIAKPVWAYDAGTPELALCRSDYQLASHSVISEGIAAFFDCMFTYDGESRLSVNSDFASRFETGEDFVLVDIGGKTTDVVAGVWNGSGAAGPTIRVGASRSIDLGMLGVAADLAGEIIREHGVRSVNDPELVMMRGILPLYGKSCDVSELVAKVRSRFVNRLRESLGFALGDIAELSAIIFVGGGTETLRENITGEFRPEQLVIPDTPRFANALGMAKFLKLLHDSRKD